MEIRPRIVYCSTWRHLTSTWESILHLILRAQTDGSYVKVSLGWCAWVSPPRIIFTLLNMAPFEMHMREHSNVIVRIHTVFSMASQLCVWQRVWWLRILSPRMASFEKHTRDYCGRSVMTCRPHADYWQGSVVCSGWCALLLHIEFLIMAPFEQRMREHSKMTLRSQSGW